MARLRRLPLIVGLPLLALTGCVSLGPKVPPTLLRLTPDQTKAAMGPVQVTPGKAVVVMIPTAPAEIAALRVPVRTGATELAYVKDAQWVDSPIRLFRDLLAETIRARTGRAAIEAREAQLAPGVRLSGRLVSFGVEDGSPAQAVVVYEAVLQRRDKQVESSRFEARVPVSAVTEAGVGPALNTAANQVAAQVADWVGP